MAALFITKPLEFFFFSPRVVVRATTTTRTMTGHICRKNIWICMIFNTNVICAYLDTRNNELKHPRGFSLQIPWNSSFFTRVVVRVIVGAFLKELNKEINSSKKTPTMTRTTTRVKKQEFQGNCNEKPRGCTNSLFLVLRYAQMTFLLKIIQIHMFFLQIWAVIVRVVVEPPTTTRGEKSKIQWVL